MAVSMTFNMRPPLKTAIRMLKLTQQEIDKIDGETLTQFTAWGIREIQKSMTSSGQGQPGGDVWKELSASWAGFKSLVGWSPLIGVASGAMKQSTSGEADKRNKLSRIGVGGQASGYAERFNATRPILPEDDYAADKLQKLHFTNLGR